MEKIFLFALMLACVSICDSGKSYEIPQLNLVQRNSQTAHDDDRHRVKRKIFNFVIHPSKKWDPPIKYMFDRDYTQEQKDIVTSIIRDDFMTHTCIAFLQVSGPPPSDEQFIRFRRNDDQGSCFSEVGMEQITATVHGQPIYLGDACFNNRNGVLYTIASTLGMLNEVNRPDREYYVNIEDNHINDEDRFNFAIHSSDYFSVHDIPYDYGSIMHASPNRGLKEDVRTTNASALTVVPVDKQYMYAPGQTAELSFYDYKALNLVYCNATCSYRKQCQNGGYQDPVECQKCKCRDGYGGSSCQDVISGTSTCSPSSGLREVTNEIQCVKSPNHGTLNNTQYHFGDSCAWQLSAPSDRLIDLWFEDLDLFSVPMSLYSTCFHWVEIRHHGLDQPRGVRYCSNANRNMLRQGFAQEAVVPIHREKNITTRSSETMVIFKAPHIEPHIDGSVKSRYGGFTLCYKISDMLPEELATLRPPLPPTGDLPQDGSAESANQTSRRDNNNHWLVIGGVIAGVVILLIFLLFVGIIACLIKKKKRVPPSPPRVDAAYQAGVGGAMGASASAAVVVSDDDIDVTLTSSKKEDEANAVAYAALTNPALQHGGGAAGGAFHPPTYSEMGQPQEPPPGYEVMPTSARVVEGRSDGTDGAGDIEGYENPTYDNIDEPTD